MKTLIQKARVFAAQKKTQLAIAASGAMATLPAAFAEPALANDTLEGLPSVGEDLGGFLTNLTPGVIGFVMVIGIVGGILAIIYAVAMVIKKAISRGR